MNTTAARETPTPMPALVPVVSPLEAAVVGEAGTELVAEAEKNEVVVATEDVEEGDEENEDEEEELLLDFET